MIDIYNVQTISRQFSVMSILIVIVVSGISA